MSKVTVLVYMNVLKMVFTCYNVKWMVSNSSYIYVQHVIKLQLNMFGSSFISLNFVCM